MGLSSTSARVIQKDLDVVVPDLRALMCARSVCPFWGSVAVVVSRCAGWPLLLVGLALPAAAPCQDAARPLTACFQVTREPWTLDAPASMPVLRVERERCTCP
jgi:hypothetical protein